MSGGSWRSTTLLDGLFLKTKFQSDLHLAGKSIGFSLMLHGFAVVVLGMLSLPSRERSVFIGRREAITMTLDARTIESAAAAMSFPREVSLAEDPTEVPEAEPTKAMSEVIDPVPPSRRSLPRAQNDIEKSLIAEMHLAEAIVTYQQRDDRPVMEPPKRERNPRSRKPSSSLATFRPSAVVEMPSLVGLDFERQVDFSGNPPPAYPQEAIRAGVQGVVKLRMTVASDGRVTKVDVVESSGHGVLDRAAVDAVKRWRGKPALKFGRAVESVEVIPIRFRL